MILIRCEERGRIWFSVAFDERLMLLSTGFSTKNRAEALGFIMRYLPFGVAFTEDLEREHLDFAREVLDVLEATFNGRGTAWKFPLPLTLPAFTREVLGVVSRIPRGYVTAYGEIAKVISESSAARAVAKAVASNPFPLLIPCHRVVKANLELGGYVLGGGVKRKLLKREAHRDWPDSIVFYYNGQKLRLTSTWKILHKM